MVTDVMREPRTKHPEAGQDGGVCTALLLHGMQNGTLEGVVAGEEIADNLKWALLCSKRRPTKLLKVKDRATLINQILWHLSRL